MDLREKFSERNIIFSGKVFDVYDETVILPDGKPAKREIVKHYGGVCVIPLDGDSVYMVRQYRRGVDDICLEFPAGKLEKNENHYEAGLRELKEEIGATAEKYEYIGKIYPTPAYCSEIIHMYLADKLTIGEQNTDEDEFLDVERVKVSELIHMVNKGQINDAKTIIGAYRIAEYMKRNR